MQNNFDLLRFLFAGTVCLVHIFTLSLYDQLAWIIHLSSDMAVKAFFVVSGFLIFMSYERSSSLASYAKKRIRRIYPAYFVTVMLCALCLVTLSSKSPGDYFSLDWIQYVLANLSFLNFLHPTLPGVFETNRLQVINGALWTLKVEVLFYMAVPVLVVLFRKLNRIGVIISVYILSFLYTFLCVTLAEKTGSDFYLALSRQLPAQLPYFLGGAFFYYYLPFFERNVAYVMLFSVAVLVLNRYLPLAIFEPFAFSGVVVFFGLYMYLGNFGRFGDFSYGVYILHFPIVQCFVYFGWPAGRPWLFLMAILATTLLAAFTMWHLVEKRFLGRNNHYVQNTTSAPARAKGLWKEKYAD